MDDLIATIARDCAVSNDVARKVAGVVFSLMRNQGHAEKVAAVFAALPGADVLADEGTAGGGLMGKMAGGMMGGPLAAMSKLQGLGLSPATSKTAMSLVIDHAKLRAGDKLVRDAASNIPGLNGYL